MPNDYNMNDPLSRRADFNAPPVTDWFGQNHYNPSNLSYGYPYGEPYNGCVPYAPDITINHETYKYDPLTDSWGKEISNNKNKVKVETLTGGFSIIRKLENKSPDSGRRFVILEYTTKKGVYAPLIPNEDYIKEKFHKYLKEIFRYPNCTKRKFDALVAFLLQSVPTQDIMMFPHQGWNETENGELDFASDPQYVNIPRSLLSPSVKRRKLFPLIHSPQEIIQKWLDIYGKNPTLQFIGYYHIGSLFQHFFRQAGLYVHQYLIVEPSEGLDDDKLKAMLATNDIDNFPVAVLSSGEDKILAELKLVFDGIALYIDDCFADEEKEMISGLKAITRAVRGEALKDDRGNGLAVVISKNASYTATRLYRDNVIVINTDGIEVETDTDAINDITGEMDTFVISVISSNLAEIVSYINNDYLNLFRRLLSEIACKESAETMTMYWMVEYFFRNFLGFSMLKYESFQSLLQTVDCKSDRVMNACEAIEREFFLLLSKMIRSKSIIPVLKRRGMCIDNDGKTFIVDGNRLYIPVEIIEALLAQMTTTHSLESLMRALRQTKVLVSTDGNTHPIEVHNSTGVHQRLYFYDVSAEILDADVLYKLQNIECEEFLLDESEVPKKDFLTILRDAEGRVAGKQICYADEENGHSYISGQSGWGKTYLLCQLLAKCFKLGNRVVVFDSSDSFTYEALCRNLSKRFVDSNITIHDLDKDGIPVDLFRIDHNATLPTKKKQLLGILQAAIGELSSPQSNALRTLLTDVIRGLGDDERIYCISILNKLNEVCKENENRTCESLKNHLRPLVEEIEKCGITDVSWGEFLRTSNDIVVIRTDSSSSKSSNQIIDMMLATLYLYQRDNPQVALDVFIDELQNQNLSETGPIRKIMKEGRKIHMSFFGATQDYYPRNTELGSVMGKAGTQMFLRPTSNSENVVAAELRFNKAEKERFDGMMRGDVIVKANLFNRALGRNVPTTLSGHVDDYPKIPDKYDDYDL